MRRKLTKKIRNIWTREERKKWIIKIKRK